MADHPVKVPPELLKQWISEAYGGIQTAPGEVSILIADRAAQWGADQELEGCCAWLRSHDILEPAIDALRTTRRPTNPPSLAEQGIEALRSTICTDQRHYDALLAAINRLAELEAQQ